MKDKFTPQMFSILTLGHKIAEESGDSELKSHHLLAALTKHPLTQTRLEMVGVTYEALIQVILHKFPPAGKKARGNITLSKEVQALVVEAFNQSVKTAENQQITTDTVLLAITRMTSSNAYKCLESLETDISQFSALILASITANKGKEPNTEDGGDTVLAKGSDAPRTQKGKGKTPLLERYAFNVTRAAKEGKLDPVIGREKEVKRTLQILTRRSKNNPVLVGEPGVGKSAIVEGLAQKLLTTQNLPPHLTGKDIWSLDLGEIISGTKYRGDFEQRLKGLVKEVQSNHVILFIDEIHSIINAGNGEGSVTAANILKPMLARGELQTIGATTYDEYRKYFEKDAAMARRFQQVPVKEPSVEACISILQGLKHEYEKHHNIILTDEAIEAAVRLSSRYIADRFLPDKAIDLMDEAGAEAKIESFNPPPELLELETELADVVRRKEDAVRAEEFMTAAELTEQEKNLRHRVTSVTAEFRTNPAATTITAENIAKVVTETTGIPVLLDEKDHQRFRMMEQELSKRIIGQHKAINSIAKSVRRQRAGLKDPNRPAGSFIFAGSTGVGKTEAVKALAEFLFQDETALITLDMSEYSEKHTVSRLFGAPPGFVGFEEGGQLTEQVRRKPYSVILFDEIEKAHEDIFNSLLQILEEGRLTDSQGRVVDFKNTVIVMTTNVGARQIQSGGTGFRVGDAKTDYETIKSKVKGELKQKFKPEFLNRVDDIVVFSQLTSEELTKIAELNLEKLNKRLEENNLFNIEVTQPAKDYLITVEADVTLGARPLRRAIQNLIEDALSEMIIYGVDTQNTVTVNYVNETLTFNGLTTEDIENYTGLPDALEEKLENALPLTVIKAETPNTAKN